MLLPLLGLAGLAGFTMPLSASAAAAPLTFRYAHFLFTVAPDKHPEWRHPTETWIYNGQPISPLAELRVDGDEVPAMPQGIERQERVEWDTAAIAATLQSAVAASFDRPAGAVTISRGSGGMIRFDGVGLTGRKVDIGSLAALTADALENGVTEIVLPVTVTQPQVTVTDPELAAQGIKEVVTIGESDFANSPSNRRHNIATGLSKFNGHLIPRGATFSFDQTLGRVDGTTGYLKELVIKGARTEPDYGGGLCQVSSTAYRGAWEYGFPIVDRKNHSYAVSHYAPQGTDATVYPPSPDMKFLNDSPGALLMQTYSQDDKAYFVYYGTRDKRASEVFGPFIWDRTSPPPDRMEFTTDLAPGQKRKLGERVPGMKAAWFRTTVEVDGTTKVEPVFSNYEARPLFYQVGIAATLGTPAEDGTLPDSIDLPVAPQIF